MSGFYSNALKVGVGLVANLRRFDGLSSRVTFLVSTARHALVILLKVPLKPKVRSLRFSGLEIRYKEFTGELGNIKTVFFDEDEALPVPYDARVLDVGANIGLFTLYLVHKYGRERFKSIHLFEPNPDTYERLAYNLKANGLEGLCTAHLLALSDKAGTVYMESPRGYSVLNMVSDTGTVPVESKPLDLWRREHGDDAVDLLKIDVEGHEMALLRGAPATLAATSHVFIEVRGTHLQEFHALVAGAGFVVQSRQDLPAGDSMILLERRGDPVANP